MRLFLKFASVFILVCLMFEPMAQAKKSKARNRKPAKPKVEAPPSPKEAEVKFVLAPESLEAALAWVKNQKGTYQTNHIFFFDTPELELFQLGVLLRVRRRQDDTYDVTAKLRSKEMPELPALKGRSRKNLSCEKEVTEKDILTSCSYVLKTKKVLPSVNASQVSSYFKPEHRRFAQTLASDFDIRKLVVYGRINEARWELDEAGIVFQLWSLPHGERIVELSKRVPLEKIEDTKKEMTEKVKGWGFKLGDTEFKSTLALQRMKDEGGDTPTPEAK